jgi:hypothetical protein
MFFKPLEDTNVRQAFGSSTLKCHSDLRTRIRLLRPARAARTYNQKEKPYGSHVFSKSRKRPLMKRQPSPLRFFFLTLLISSQAQAQSSAVQKAVGGLESYLNMAGSHIAKDFHPLTQRERTDLYLRSLTNPWGFAKAAMSAGIDQSDNKPQEWGQGWGPYGERVANIEGQYVVQKTVTYLISSPLHEDNRYFGSGKHGFWPRTKYAVASSLLARHDNGKLYVSVSQLGGVAAGAFAARLWLPPSQSEAGDAAVSFGITTGGNTAASVLKEFLPDLFRLAIRKKSGQTPDSNK